MTLLLPTKEQLDFLEANTAAQAVCSADVKGWEERLKAYGPKLIAAMRDQRQRMNDCEGQTTANSDEAGQFYLNGKIVQMSDIYAYNGSEMIDRGSVGANSGASIQSGVILLTAGIKKFNIDPGLPTEQDWPYDSYETNTKRFLERAKGAALKPSYIAQQGPPPEWDTLLPSLAAGGRLHIGIFWAPKFVQMGKYFVWSKNVWGGEGHALCIITALFIDGQWYLVVWNSHGNSFRLMPRKNYEEYLERGFNPFKAYLVMPDKPVERFYDRTVSGGGYLPFNVG